MILISHPFAGGIFDGKGHGMVILSGLLVMMVGLVTLSYATSVYIF